MLRRLREHGVQRDDERLCERFGERQDVLAVGAAEDAVLVLEEHDVDVEPAEHARGADVVAADRLPDRREERAPLRARRLVQDRDDVDRSMPSTPSSVPRRSAAKVPMPQERGGNVETIAVRTALATRAGPCGHGYRLHALGLLQAAADRRR